jgi:hypothetical protein
MEFESELRPAVPRERGWARKSRLDAEPAVDERNDEIEIIVPFTTIEAARSSLEEAGTLASDLRVRIRVIAVVFVPFAAPFECSPVSVHFLEGVLGGLSSACPVEREIYLTRDPDQTWEDLLSPGSLVVITARMSRWYSRESRLARKLRRRGHHVCVVEPGAPRLAWPLAVT